MNRLRPGRRAGFCLGILAVALAAPGPSARAAAAFERPAVVGQWSFPEVVGAPVRALASSTAPPPARRGLWLANADPGVRLVRQPADLDPTVTPDFRQGAVRLLFRPAWATDTGFLRPGMMRGRGPGHPGRLFQAGIWTDDASEPCVALLFDERGGKLMAVSHDGRGRSLTNFLVSFLYEIPQIMPGRETAPPRWHEIVLNFSPARTEMILDGGILKEERTGSYAGPGIPAFAPDRAPAGFAFGSDLAGDNCAEGWIDEIELYSAPISLLETHVFRERNALSARVEATPPTVSLEWFSALNPAVDIRRRSSGASDWTVVARNVAGRTWVDRDPDLQTGATYEYRIGERAVVVPIAAAPVEQRGHVLLLIDDTLERRLRPDLDRFTEDLVGDGWTVSRREAPRHDDRAWDQQPINDAYRENVARVKNMILDEHRATEGRLAAVILIGHVVIPYSGTGAEDGHTDNRGAWPADAYYGDLDGEWTDRVVDTGAAVRDPVARNIPGDGKFDPGVFRRHILPERPPEDQGVEIAVGRIDFANLPAFTGRSELDLLRLYLDKNRRYRHHQLRFDPVIVAGGFFHSVFNINGRAVYDNALRTAAGLFPGGAGATWLGDAFGSRVSCLWSMQGGYGGPFAIHVSPEANRALGIARYDAQYLDDPDRQPRIGFHLLKGSYFANWNRLENNFMRACLALPDSGLAAVWTIDTLWRFEETGAGAPIGSAFVRTARDAASVRTTFILGDPTLRLQITPPPARLRADARRGNVELAWIPVPHPEARYLVHRSLNGLDGPHVRLTPDPVADASFTDPDPPRGRKLYQVRTLLPVTTGSGTFTNISQAAFVERR